MSEMYVAHTLIAPNEYVEGRGLLSSRGKYLEELIPGRRPDRVRDAIIAADAYGRAFREGAPAEEYTIP